MVSTRDIAKKAGLRLIECENGLGLLPFKYCAARSLVAQGKRPGDSGIKASACNGCAHGEKRAAAMNGKSLDVRFRPGRGVPTKRKSWKPRRKVERAILVRPCALKSCGQTFEVRTVADANRQYHSEECRRIAQLERASMLPAKATRSKPCVTEGCKNLVFVYGNERRCDICRALRGEMRFRRRGVTAQVSFAS